MKSIKELEKDIEELVNLIKTKPNRNEKVSTKWKYFKHGKEGQLKSLKEVLELIEELKNSESVRARYHEKTIINMCEYLKQRITEGERT